MKRIVLMFLGVMSFSMNSFAQECKYKIQKVDKFTGISEVETKPLLLQSKLKTEVVKLGDIEMILSKKGEERFFTLSFKWVAKGMPVFGSVESGMENSRLIIILANNEKVELAMSGVVSDRMKSDIITHFTISKEAFDLLSSQDITDVRAMAVVNSFDFKVEDGVSTKSAFNCIK